MQYQEALPTAPVKQKSPAQQLMSYLKNNGLNKDEVGSFVKDELCLSSDNVEGIENILADKDVLNHRIQGFLGAKKEKGQLELL
jgi:hypothetical protein